MAFDCGVQHWCGPNRWPALFIIYKQQIKWKSIQQTSEGVDRGQWRVHKGGGLNRLSYRQSGVKQRKKGWVRKGTNMSKPELMFLVFAGVTVRISSPSCYQGVDKARGTQVDIQSEEKASSDCTTIYKVVRKLPDHVTLSGTWYGPWQKVPVECRIRHQQQNNHDQGIN